jgi:hypothetical protein
MKTGSLTTVAITADQVVLTYTVTTGKTFFLEYVEFDGAQTTPAGGNAVVLGTISLETPSGTKVVTRRMLGGGAFNSTPFAMSFPEPLPISSTTVIRVVTTPASTTSFYWGASFGGYER